MASRRNTYVSWYIPFSEKSINFAWSYMTQPPSIHLAQVRDAVHRKHDAIRTELRYAQMICTFVLNKSNLAVRSPLDHD